MDKIKKHFRRLPAFIFLLVTGFHAKAQNGIHFEAFSRMDSVIGVFMNDRQISGGSVAVVKNGKLVYSKGFGFSDFEKSQPAEPNSLFRIASISKPVTAIAIMKLVEEGRLSLTAQVFGQGAIIADPYYLNVIGDQRIYSITVGDLLTHTSGWDRNVPYGPFQHCDAPFFPLYVTESEAEPNPVGDSTLIRFKLGNGLNYTPGTHYSYSNVGYLVLGKIVERVSGMPYETYVKKNILEPAGVYDMHLGRNLRSQKMDREVDYVSYAVSPSCYGDGSMVLSQYGGFNLEAMNAHGGWIASAPDLARLLVALDNGTILKKETRELMLRAGSVNPNYAFGWQVNEKGNYWHTGSLDGTAAFAATTKDGYTWVVLFNSRSDNSLDFWKALDKLPRTAIRTVREFPGVDLFSPSQNATNVTARAMGPGTVHLRWQNGTGDGRIVIAGTSPVPALPLEGATYFADPEFELGSEIGENAFVVYDGTGTRATITNLDPSVRYYFTVIEYNRNARTGGKPVYKLGGIQSVTERPESWVKM